MSFIHSHLEYIHTNIRPGIQNDMMRRSNTFIYLVLYEFCDFPQILEQLLLSLRRLLPARVERSGSAVAAERRAEHLLILEQSGPVEMQLRVTGGSSVHFLLQMGKRGIKY